MAAAAVGAGGFWKGQELGGASEPSLRLMDLRLGGSSGNTVIRLMITNGTSRIWEFSVRIPKPDGVPIPELYSLDQNGRG